MKLATAIKKIQADSSLSGLGYLHNGRPHYVSLVSFPGGIQFETDALASRTTMLPFDLDAADPATKELIALVAKEVDWTLFRGGLPVEE